MTSAGSGATSLAQRSVRIFRQRKAAVCFAAEPVSSETIVASIFVEDVTTCICAIFDDDCDACTDACSESTCSFPGDTICDRDFVSGAIAITSSPVFSVANVTVSWTDSATSFDVVSNRDVTFLVSFGDGNEATVEANTEVSHAYVVPGVYNVSVTSSEDESDSILFNIAVHDPPTINSVC